VVAVLAGALFLQRAQRLVPVFVAARDLPSGVPLGRGDLTVVRVRLPDAELRHYLRPASDQRVTGRVLAAPLRRDMLVPAELMLASPKDADLVELPVQADPGDMAQDLRPGDLAQVLAAYTDGSRRGRAVVLLDGAEVVRVLDEPGSLNGPGRHTGVQLRLPSRRAPLVAAAIATARIFVVKTAPGDPRHDQDPSADDPTLEDPSAGDPSVGDPATQDPSAPGVEGSAPDPVEPPATGAPDGSRTSSSGPDRAGTRPPTTPT
jgi:hypothetical protein